MSFAKERLFEAVDSTTDSAITTRKGIDLGGGFIVRIYETQ
jgi:hypothetical protein